MADKSLWDVIAYCIADTFETAFNGVVRILLIVAEKTNRNVSFWTRKTMSNPILFLLFFRVLPVVALFVFMRRRDLLSGEGLVAVLLLVIMFSIMRE